MALRQLDEGHSLLGCLFHNPHLDVCERCKLCPLPYLDADPYLLGTRI